MPTEKNSVENIISIFLRERLLQNFLLSIDNYVREGYYGEDTTKNRMEPQFLGRMCRNLWVKPPRLFKVERKHHHVGRGFIDAFCVDMLSRVGKVVALLVKHIAQAEAEFQFWNQFEERQV